MKITSIGYRLSIVMLCDVVSYVEQGAVLLTYSLHGAKALHFNNILPSKPGLPSVLLRLGFPTKTLYMHLSPIRATFPPISGLLLLLLSEILLMLA